MCFKMLFWLSDFRTSVLKDKENIPETSKVSSVLWKPPARSLQLIYFVNFSQISFIMQKITQIKLYIFKKSTL